MLALCMLFAGCDSKRPAPQPPATPANTPPAAPPADLSEELADDRTKLANQHFISGDYGQALALAVSALSLDPENPRARSVAAGVLTTANWQIPEFTLPHGMRVDHLHFAAPSSLWVSLRGAKNTTVRWNLDDLRIESVLFPVRGEKTRSLVFDSTHEWMVVERAGVTLLCNAKSLQPVRDLGPLPQALTPSSAIAFSPDALLVAHPTLAGTDGSAVVWQVRDTKTGELVRSSDPAKPGDPPPLAAILDRKALRVLRQDGSLRTMPVSPLGPVELTAPRADARFLHARFADNGCAALVLRDRGAHQSPKVECLRFSPGEDSSLAPAKLRESEPWTRQPCLWTGLYRASTLAPKTANGAITFPFIQHPFRSASPFTAAAFSGDRTFLADRNGDVTAYRGISITSRSTDKAPAHADPKILAALKHLCEALAGGTYDETQGKFIEATMDQRVAAAGNCDLQALEAFLPELDPGPAIAALKDFKPVSPPADALAMLTDRLASVEAPELAKVFEQADDEAVPAAIKAAGPKGPAAAKALELALASTRPEWIEACLAGAQDLPPLLRKLALSRIAWLQDRKADAIAGWPDEFPDLEQVRLREDWNGWEGADYSQALEKLRLCVSEELAALVIPENPTAEQRQAVITRLLDPATAKAVGRARFASACLKAALALAPFKEDTEATFKLASLARNLGEDPAPCLRAEALSLTALGDYQQARDRWVTLITEHPAASHLPGDYAEAAYTSFENADPQQAMAILTTGMHRFPNDANFALRAGWVALLTGNAERAYRFLLTGRQIGYPPEKLENATALMAIAAVQTGAAEDAAVFHQDLIRMDAAWKDPATIESLEWPEELKASLRQLVW